VSENSIGESAVSGILWQQRQQNWPVAARGKASALKPGLERRVCQPPRVSASVNQKKYRGIHDGYDG
jgi:hypothetical protein